MKKVSKNIFSSDVRLLKEKEKSIQEDFKKQTGQPTTILNTCEVGTNPEYVIWLENKLKQIEKQLPMDNNENNILLAKFVEFKTYEGYSFHTKFYTPYLGIDGNQYETKIVHKDSLKFHQSWDWLMLVIDKIMEICFECDENTEEELNDPEDFYAIRDCIPDINQTYKSAVEFVKNYNPKNKK